MNIFPCNKYFCKCVEYLNFANKKHMNIYKHCLITSNNNLKYNNKLIYNTNDGHRGSTLFNQQNNYKTCLKTCR